MKRVMRAVVATALLSTAIGSAAAPASAERWWGRDEAGDVAQFRYVFEPPPCGTLRETPTPDDTTTDLAGLGVRHEDGVVELRAHFRDLTAWGRRLVSFEVETAHGQFELSIARWRKNHAPEVSLHELGEPGPVDECGAYSVVGMGGPCEGMTATRSFTRDVVTVVIPRSCLDSPAWVRVGARVQREIGKRTRYDTWGTPEQDDSGRYLSATSPRVRHTR